MTLGNMKFLVQTAYFFAHMFIAFMLASAAIRYNSSLLMFLFGIINCMSLEIYHILCDKYLDL